MDNKITTSKERFDSLKNLSREVVELIKEKYLDFCKNDIDFLRN